MSVILKEHNQEAYERVKKGFEEKNKIAVVEPPGTGKSFIALKWIEENQDKKTLLLVPSYSIQLQYEEHMKASGYKLNDFPNLKIMTYSKLGTQIDSGDFSDINHIVLDEFHRCGAPVWGKGVIKLLEKNPSAKVLGLSATPIRYLDQNRDMSDELFDNHVVFQMDLTEAVARGILTFPTYVNGIYKLDQDIKRYEKQIEKIIDLKLKKELKEKLELAKRNLEKATKLDELFSKYIQKQNGKYIIFCKDKEHMEAMMKEVPTWFSKVNSEIDTYSVYYNNSNNEKELKEFYSSTNSNIKLLFCIDMLNEGLHVENIDGIVMLRPTISPILFLQQLGRAFAVGNSNTIVFDIVNNVKSNQDMKNFREKVKRKIETLLKENKIKQRPNLGSFEILGEIRTELEVLEEIECILQTETSKEAKIKLVEEFYKEYGRLPKQSEKVNKIAIGSFLYNIKHGHTQITEEQLNRLQVLGFTMKIKDVEAEKEEKIRLIEDFYRKNGRLPKRREKVNEIAIGLFLNSLKQGHTQITEEQLNRLKALGFTMKIKDVEREKEEKIRLIEEFYRENGRLPKQSEKVNGIVIGTFLSSLKQGHTQITEEQLNRLKVLGFTMEIKDVEREKEEKIRLIEKFYRENGRLPKRSEKVNKIAIGLFLYSLKQGHTQITEEQLNKLQVLGFTMEVRDIEAEKEEKIKLVEDFYKKNERLPKTMEKENGIAIGSFLNSIKQGHTQITEEQLNRLKVLGFTMEIKDVEREKEEKIRLIEKFYKENGRLPKQSEKVNEIAIGAFLNRVKQGHIQITEEQLNKLQVLGFTMEIKNVEREKEEKIRLIEKFYRENGRLPKQSEKVNEIAIGIFLSSVKRGHTQITIEQKLRLQNIGVEFKNNRSEERKQLIEQLKKEKESLMQVSESAKVFVKK